MKASIFHPNFVVLAHNSIAKKHALDDHWLWLNS